jgi:hypothetical protein
VQWFSSAVGDAAKGEGGTAGPSVPLHKIRLGESLQAAECIYKYKYINIYIYVKYLMHNTLYLPHNKLNPSALFSSLSGLQNGF